MTPEQTFARALQTFDGQVAEATHFWLARMAIAHEARRNRHTLAALNRTPLFWNTVTGALQFAAIVAVGRVFDDSKGAKQTIDTLLNFARDHHEVLFSKAALEARKRRRGAADVDDWIENYLASAYVPTDEDFKRLARLTRRHRRTYTAQYANIRHKHLAHTALTDQGELAALFAKTSRLDLERLLGFLNQMHGALWNLFDNGHPPRLRPIPYSSASLARRRLNTLLPIVGTVADRSTSDARRCLRLLTAAATPPKAVKARPVPPPWARARK